MTNKRMTDSALRAEVRALGLGYAKKAGEYEIYPLLNRGNGSYFTDCAQDALETARAMHEERKKLDFFGLFDEAKNDLFNL